MTRRGYHCRGQPGLAHGKPAVIGRQNRPLLPGEFATPERHKNVPLKSGTTSSNPVPSSNESANFRSLSGGADGAPARQSSPFKIEKSQQPPPLNPHNLTPPPAQTSPRFPPSRLFGRGEAAGGYHRNQFRGRSAFRIGDKHQAQGGPEPDLWGFAPVPLRLQADPAIAGAYFPTMIAEVRFAHNSLLEEDGFELVVPLSKRTAVPSSPFGFPVDGTGCERCNLRKRRFRVPGSQGNLARQGTCVVLNGWCIEACVGGVTGWAIGAGGDPRKPLRDCPADGGARESPRPSDVRSSQRGGSGRQRRSGIIGRNRRAARAVARSPRSTDRSEERGT